MSVNRRGPVHQVACLVFDGLAPFEMAIAVEVFATPRPELDVPWWYAFTLCAETPGRQRSVGGFDLQVNAGLEAIARADTVIVPNVPDVRVDPAPKVLDALVAAHRRGARMVSICSGAFALAAAGLLDGREATTHWRHVPALRERYPKIKVNPSVLYVDSGSVLTSAGTAAGIDLCLHLIRRDHGPAVANQVANRMVVAGHREGGQAQFIDEPVRGALADDPIAAAVAHVRDRIGDPLPVEELARVAHLSTRQFERRFHEEMRIPPAKWVLRQRIEASKPLLAAGDLAIDAVAARVGLSNSGFRHNFRRVTGISPIQYRRQYG